MAMGPFINYVSTFLEYLDPVRPYVEEHSHMTSDVLGVFLTYVPTYLPKSDALYINKLVVKSDAA